MAKAGARKIAMLAGEPYYFTGCPCVKGHISKRYVSDKSCFQCRTENVEDKESVRIRTRRWYLINKEKSKKQSYAWRKENSERHAETAKIWRFKNREKLNARSKQWRANNREKWNAAIARWRKRNPELSQKHSQYYGVIQAAIRRGASGSFSRDDLFAIVEKQNKQCVYCKIHLTKIDFDHIMPIALGGQNNIENIQALCPTCNRRKGKMHPDKFKEFICQTA